MRSILVSILLVLPTLPLTAAPSDLILSEYTEGSSLNKAIEIYNGTTTAIDLDAGQYRLELYSNGSPTPTASLALSGVIVAGDVFVLANPSAAAALIAEADVTNGSVINWNGDDAIVLARGTTIVDSIGQRGVDPGSQWGSGLASTADNALRRRADVCAGDSTPDDAFDPAAEWDGFPTDTFDGFGVHISTCPGVPPPPAPALSVDDVSVVEGDAGTTDAAFTVTLSTPAGASGVTFTIATRDGTATSGSGDYVARTATTTIAHGASSFSFAVSINGDETEEPDEAFFVDVTAVSGATVAKGTGEAAVLNDDLPAAGTARELFFSEYIEGGGFDKAIEIFNGTGGPIDLADGGYRLELYTNGSASPSRSLDLEGVIAPGDVLVIAHASASPAIARDVENEVANWNGDDAIVLTRGGVVIDAFGQTGIDPGSRWESDGVSTQDRTLRRKVDICAGDTVADDPFAPSLEWESFNDETYDGFGTHVSACIPGEPPPPLPPTLAPIPVIQGSGDASLLANRRVETIGNVVTAVGPQGFFIQDPAGDGEAATSDGIYVFTGSAADVAPGDVVNVSGRVVEFFGMTEFGADDLTWSITGTAAVPAAVAIGPDFRDFESVEGMLVQVRGGAAARGTDRFGSTPIVASPVRPFRAAGDDPDAIFEVDPTDLGGDAAHQDIVGGASIEFAEGPMTWSFSDYVVWTTSLEYTNPPFPRPVRGEAAGEMSVAAQNLLRLFDDRDDPNIGEPVPDTAEYQARLDVFAEHILTNLGAPDVLAVSEVENQMTLEDLASRLNAIDPVHGYDAFVLEGNDVGGIDVGFLVRRTVLVDEIVQLGKNDTWTAPPPGATETLNDRPPLLLQGSYVGNGQPFPISVIAVHQRSMIGLEDGPRVVAKRLEQASRLAGYINDLKAADPSVRVVVAGDFNAFEASDDFEDFGDPMGTLASGAELTNQVFTVPADDRYSYVHEGLAQVLDHALTTSALNPFVRGLEFARRNADAPELVGAPSDHDGLVLFVMTDHDADGLPDDGDACSHGDARPTVILGACDSGSPNVAFEGGCTLTDRLLELGNGARNHGAFVSAAAAFLRELESAGALTESEAGAIQSCVARYKP